MGKSIAKTPWVTAIGQNPHALLRLFCFPYAGGGTSAFRGWASKVPQVEVCPIQLPGREARLAEPPLTRLSLLAETLAPAIAAFQDIPYAFFGHSLGALISFEVARQLRRLGQRQPVHLIASGRMAPQIKDEKPSRHILTDDALLEELRHLEGTPSLILEDPELVQFFLPIIRADFEICETYLYSPEPPLDCPISAFGGEGDDRVHLEGLAAWELQTRDRFALRMFPGNHFFLRDCESSLLRVIIQDLLAHRH